LVTKIVERRFINEKRTGNHISKCFRTESGEVELNEGDKAIVALYLEGIAYKEISSILGLSENHIAVKVKRIKAKLLNCINKNYDRG